MARRRFHRRNTTRTRRRGRPCDVLPLNLCAQSLVIPPPGPDEDWSCDNPQNLEFVILDGAALDTILKQVNPTAFFEGGQGASRGISFLGAEFWARLSFNDQFSNFLDHNTYMIEMRIACALVVREWSRFQGLAVATTLPNLFSQDEREANGHVIYRWPLYLGPFAVMNADFPTYVAQLSYGDTQGGNATIYQDTGPIGTTTLQQAAVGSGTTNMVHHRVRRRAFLDEDHYLSLCFSFAWGVGGAAQNDTFALGLEANGLLKVRQR